MENIKRIIKLHLIIAMVILSGACGGNKKNNRPNQQENDIKTMVLQVKQPSNASFYIETSAGMKGYFPKNETTDFKTHCYEIMNEFTGTINYLNSKGVLIEQINIPEFDIAVFSQRNFSGTTHLIKMLKTIVSTDTIADAVSVFASDLRYDPKEKEKDGTNDKLAVYKTDLSKIFDSCKNNGRAVSLICATSKFNDGKTNAAVSPYYYLIFGKVEQVAYTRNKIIEKLGKTYVAYYEAGMDYQSLSYSYTSPKSKDNCQKIGDNEFHINDGKKECAISIEIDDILSISPYLKNCKKEDFIKLWNFKGNNRVDCKIENYQFNDTSLIMKLKIDVAQMAANSAEITWKLNDIPFNIPAFEAYYTNDYNGGNEDSEKSFSINQLIEAMKEYPNRFDTSEHKIVITKSK